MREIIRDKTGKILLKKPLRKRAWAVVDKRGKIVCHENDGHALIYSQANIARMMVWHDGERVMPVAISYGR